VLTDPRSALPGSVDMLGPIVRVRGRLTLNVSARVLTSVAIGAP